jgi:hypothetical protein
MIPVDFEGTNIELVKPPEMTDEQCMPVMAYTDTDNDGYTFFLTAWMPNQADIEAVNAGRPIFLKILGRSVPPVAMYTMDAEDNCNSPR